MSDPVIDPTTTGSAFERKAIEEWVKEHGRSFVTRQSLAIAELRPDEELREAIQSWKKARQDRFRVIRSDEL